MKSAFLIPLVAARCVHALAAHNLDSDGITGRGKRVNSPLSRAATSYTIEPLIKDAIKVILCPLKSVGTTKCEIAADICSKEDHCIAFFLEVMGVGNADPKW